MHQELSTAPAKRRRFSPVLLLMWVLILGLGAGLGYMVWISKGCAHRQAKPSSPSSSPRR
ncbi:MAG: hypothetical protein U0514_03640 [Candidatus Andersenbacteria bacterium]